MTAAEQRMGWGRSAAVAAMSLALLAAGVGLAAVAGPRLFEPDVAQPLLLVVLLLAYVFTQHYTLDFEFRRQSNSISLAHLPLALGVQVVAPFAHLAVRLGSVVVYSLYQRQAPQKALYNLGAAAFEVGAAALAVGIVPHGETGPSMWIALYAGLVVGDAVGILALHAIWRVLGLETSLQRGLRTLLLTAPVALLFTGLAVVAISAARLEAASVVVMLALTGWLALAYRAHRRVVLQQATTESLYTFVKDLGPLVVAEERSTDVLERVRVLLHAEQLDLTASSGDRWSALTVAEGQSPRRSVDV
ncbi:MAG: hypothetical protein EPN99_06755, partial [Frankiales bacterium]